MVRIEGKSPEIIKADIGGIDLKVYHYYCSSCPEQCEFKTELHNIANVCMKDGTEINPEKGWCAVDMSKKKSKIKAIATVITGFYPDNMHQIGTGRRWLTVSYVEGQNPSIDFPKSVSYEGEVYYQMSYNSDKLVVNYARAEWRSYHERYCD